VHLCAGCGHKGLALTKQKTIMLTCTDHGAIVELDLTGRQLRRRDADGKRNIYVAQWSGGKILKISPEGALLHVFAISAGDGTTNVAFGPDEHDLYVTVVKDPDDPQARGSIVKIANVQ
jgi:hypothetical protein